MLGRTEWGMILLIGLVLGATVLGTFLWALGHRTLPEARTLTFATLVFAHVFMSLAFRSRNRVLWEIGPFTNLRLVAVVALSISLQAGLLLLPAGQRVFQTVSLPAADNLRALLLGLVPVSLIELAKLAIRSRKV